MCIRDRTSAEPPLANTGTPGTQTDKYLTDTQKAVKENVLLPSQLCALSRCTPCNKVTHRRPLRTKASSLTPTRRNPTRLSKSRANNVILGYSRDPPIGAYRIPSIPDMHGVQISIAPSNFPDAGRGAFLTGGPSDDGSAPPGTILAEYGGLHFTTTADIARIESPDYHSDYLWGGINPHNNTYTIVDASNPLAGYGGFINKGFDNSNTELVFGLDNKLYVTAITTIALNEELLLSYGAPYWLEPSR